VSRLVVAVATGALVALGTGAHAAPRPTLHIVPAADVALSLLVLSGLGAKEPVVLFDPSDRAALDHYRSTWRGPVRCLHRPGIRRATKALLADVADTPCEVVENLGGLARTLWPKADTAIAAGTGDYEWLLRAAGFAAATGTALLPLDGAPKSRETFAGWELERLYVTPSAAPWLDAAAAAVPTLIELPSRSVLDATMLAITDTPPSVLVVTNPADRDGYFSPSSLSMLAPLVSAVHRAPLLLVSDPRPTRVEKRVHGFVDRQGLSPSHIVLVGDELALRSHRVPDPVLAAGGPEATGGGREVRVELFSRIHRQAPQDFAVGRIVAEGVASGSVTLARQYHRPRKTKTRPVIFFTNADGIFPLGETISRATAADLRNVGVPVRTYYGEEISASMIHGSMAATDLLVWEGHARDLTLEERGGVATAEAPEIVVLQGCYTFDRSDPFILMEKGTIALLGTSTAVYSAPGSGLARAFFDSLLYEGADLGSATRNARNFLLALAELKQQRRHGDWRKTYRAALAFSLWGDPTIRPQLRSGRPQITPVKWALEESQLSLRVPRRTLRPIDVGDYHARPEPRAMLGGLLLRVQGDDRRRLKELYFTVQDVGDAAPRAVCSPRRGWDVVSLYAPRTRTLTVLARPDWTLVDRPRQGAPVLFPLASDDTACPVAEDPQA
jgi:hypothetical protein